jgi:hypothetical protein
LFASGFSLPRRVSTDTLPFAVPSAIAHREISARLPVRPSFGASASNPHSRLLVGPRAAQFKPAVYSSSRGSPPCSAATAPPARPEQTSRLSGVMTNTPALDSLSASAIAGLHRAPLSIISEIHGSKAWQTFLRKSLNASAIALLSGPDQPRKIRTKHPRCGRWYTRGLEGTTVRQCSNLV